MADWDVWRQDDNGQRFLVQRYPERVHALARVLELESGYRHKQLYEVIGDRGPTLATNRNLYLCLLRLTDDLAGSGRPLLEYLCALWAVSRPLGGRAVLDGDDLAAMLIAAASATPAQPDPSWLVADLGTADTYLDFGDFTKVLCTQIADLMAFAGSFSPDAPPRVGGARATVPRWRNFDPLAFLECAAAGAFGGWSEADGRRVRAGARANGAWSGEDVVPLEGISWGDAAAFLEYGQSYE